MKNFFFELILNQTNKSRSCFVFIPKLLTHLKADKQGDCWFRKKKKKRGIKSILPGAEEQPEQCLRITLDHHTGLGLE